MVMKREIELQGRKSSLYRLANEWMEKTLIAEDEGIEYRNEEEGVLVGRGVTTQQSRGVWDAVFEFPYELAVHLKDGMAVATITVGYGKAWIQESMMVITEPHLMARADYERLKAQFISMMDRLASYMRKGIVAME